MFHCHHFIRDLVGEDMFGFTMSCDLKNAVVTDVIHTVMSRSFSLCLSNARQKTYMSLTCTVSFARIINSFTLFSSRP